MNALVLTALAAGVGVIVGRWSTRWERAATGRELAVARRAAQRDPLTGLRNRAGLMAELSRRAAGREPYAVLLIDLDKFKTINDCHGHAVGDVVLVEVAQRLTELLGAAGVAARLGGDEFVLVASSPTAVVSRLLGYDVARAVARPINTAGRRIEVRASVGVVQALPGDPAEALLHSADIAMYRAKTGRGQAGVAEFDTALGLAGMETDRPGARLRELTSLSAGLAGVA
jgi:diguanylate cyclase (GGDEF)-like protein